MALIGSNDSKQCSNAVKGTHTKNGVADGCIDEIEQSLKMHERDDSVSTKKTVLCCVERIEQCIKEHDGSLLLSPRETIIDRFNGIKGSVNLHNSDIPSSSRQIIIDCFEQIIACVNKYDSDNSSSSRDIIVSLCGQIRKRLNEHGNAISLCSSPMLICFVVIVLSVCLIGFVWLASSDRSKLENQDFITYYAKVDSKNHFTTTRADGCGANIIYESAFPQMILNPDHSASSFMILAEYGTGKTALRCQYFRSLSSNDYLKVSILNEEITEYLKRFSTEMDVTKMYCEKKNCLMDWSENEFAQLLLSNLVTNFINTYDTHKHNGPYLSLDEKVSLITIICYYYNGKGTTQLENFINLFLSKKQSSRYQVNGENIQQYMNHNQQLFDHLKNDLNKFSILDKDSQRLCLLLVILEGEGFENRARSKHLYGEYFRDLREFSSFIKTYLKKIPVFIIDGIDQSDHFLTHGISSGSFESFCRSSVSPSILAMVMANHFYLSLFYPKVDGVNIEDVILRKGKFPTHTISWNRKSLINYADYVLQDMNINTEKTLLKAYTDFETLVNYSEKKTAEIIDKIPTPRALHYFIMALMREMNVDANKAMQPFRATFKNINNAYKESLKLFGKKTNK